MIAHDADSNSGAQTTATTYSWNHTCTGSNLLLLVGITTRVGSTISVSGITYNSVALTLVRADALSSRRSEIWRLIAPATGTNSIAVTLTGGTPSESSGIASSFTGVDQTTPIDAQNGNTLTSGTPSTSVTTVTDNAWVFDALCEANAADTPTATASGQTKITSIALANTTAAGSYKGPVSPAAATTMSWSIAASATYAQSVVAIRPAVVAGSFLGRATLLGAG